MRAISAAPAELTPAVPRSQARRWLLFVHQLPAQPSNLRVTTWRRLQQLGAIPLKQAVYVLPDTPGTREDFEWLKTEVQSAGGDVNVFAADNVDPWSDDALVDEFRRARQEAYAELARDAEGVLARLPLRRRRGSRAPAIGRLADIFRERLTSIDNIDFFGSAGRDRVLTLLQHLEERRRAGPGTETRPVSDTQATTTYRNRLWITRPRPGVDRMSSAWLIRRFIDANARFGFAPARDAVPAGAVPFDMFGVDFSHQGEGCTFETLCAVFGLDDPALSRIAAIVHDLDLKDQRFGTPECPTVGAMIDGLQLAHQSDSELLAHGITLFESLYRSFERSMRAAGPRPLARPHRGRTAAKRRPARRKR
jgi:hypothetical protein